MRMMRMTTSPHAAVGRPQHSPWGRIDSAYQLIDGLWNVSTASHGGIYVSPTRLQSIPGWLLSVRPNAARDAWYEEDVDWSIPVLAFKEEFEACGALPRNQATGAQLVEQALRTVLHSHPDVYEALTGTKLGHGMSRARDERTFWERHQNDFLTASAWGDWWAEVPKGSCLVLGRRPKDGAEQYFLVDDAEYTARAVLPADEDLLPSACTFIVGQPHHRPCDAKGRTQAMRTFESEHGHLAIEPVTAFMDVATFRIADEHAPYLFDMGTAEQIAVITGNRGVQLSFCWPLNGRAYLLLHDGPRRGALCKVVRLEWRGNEPAPIVMAREAASRTV